ncbi:MAG: hypothetical protein A07HR60_02229 [uncultured archaeon A07HR60]|nr:MAG: hypothetical protein A07HR60_02229 [uncultured archaeon A07HR60]
MRYTYRYQLVPTDTHREQLDFYRDTCRQLYIDGQGNYLGA